MDYAVGGSNGDGGVLKVEESAAVSYAPSAGCAVEGWDGAGDEDVDFGIYLDDQEAFEAECTRLEAILIERGIMEPEDCEFDPAEMEDLGPHEPEETLEEFYRKFEEARADVLAGRVLSHEESMRNFRREAIRELRQAVENGHL